MELEFEGCLIPTYGKNGKTIWNIWEKWKNHMEHIELEFQGWAYIYIYYIYIYCGLLPVSPIPLCRWSERHLRPGIHWSQPSKLGHMDPFHAVDGYEIRETTGAGCHGDGSRLSAISLLKMVMDGYGPQLSDDLAGYIGWRLVNGLICLKPAIRSSKMTKLKLWTAFFNFFRIHPCYPMFHFGQQRWQGNHPFKCIVLQLYDMMLYR